MLTPTRQGQQLKRHLAERIHNSRRELFEWQMELARKSPPPFYCSVDLRDSGHKIVPVDSNLYPAGFNNICPDDQRSASAVFRAQVSAYASHLGLKKDVQRILILPEAHTSNAWYIENLHYLNQILTDAGFETRIGWWSPEQPDESHRGPIELVSATQKKLQAWPLEIHGSVASAGGFEPDLILLNNDFSSGYPKRLDTVEQPILPSHTLGWHSRKKSRHFLHYNRLAADFARIVGVDPWILQIDTEEVDQVNFNEDIGLDRVTQSVARVLERTGQQYRERGITQEPFVFVKNNAGTYGMGILVVRSIEEISQINRRTKNKMSVGKNKLPIESVAVQEGIPTATLVDRLAAEPVIYLVGCDLIGGFLRTNTERGTEENLNSQGMVFRKLCMSDLQKPGIEEEPEEETGDQPVLELVYGSIARISALASGIEMSEHLASV